MSKSGERFFKKAPRLGVKLRSKEKYEIIFKAKEQHLKLSISELCKSGKVSRNGFYKWLRTASKEPSLDDKLVIELFYDEKEKFGARRMRMHLQRKYGVIFNLKKVRRIMKKYSLQTKIRKKRYKNYSIKNAVHRVLPNTLERRFTQEKADVVYSTDITYLQYGGGHKAYLSVVKDLGSKEIIHHHVSSNCDVGLVIKGLAERLEVVSCSVRKNLIIHSDQGAHYTSHFYRDILKISEVTQSMSRKGNCLDNAPIESFFGHFKDESDYKSCENFVELKNEIDKYIKYYNTERPQWGLKGKTPAEYRGFIS